jgi:hypothetical protein
MGALENERRRVLDDEEIKDAIRSHLRLPPDAEVIFQIDGSALVIWTAA